MAPTTSLARLIRQSFVYSRIPALLFDDTGRVAALNIACRTLFGADAAGCVGRTSVNLTTQLGTRLRGHLIPAPAETSLIADVSRICDESTTQDARAVMGECFYDSENLGYVTLRTSCVPYLDQHSGNLAGRIVSLEILNQDVRQRFEVVLERRWNHELMWELYSVSYDRVLPELWFYRDVVERHCAAMSAVGIDSVLDIGAGTGNVTVMLLERGQRVTAVDIGAPMLQQLRNKLDDTIERNVVVIEDTAERLPQLADASFDGVTALLAFFDMQQPHLALEEAIRVLRPGGTLVITDPKERFNVNELMAEAERDLRAKGLFDRLHLDWERIQAVAPLVAQTIREIQSSAGIARRPWYAEAIYEILREKQFRDLRMEDSHLGNCSTIWAIKPA